MKKQYSPRRNINGKGISGSKFFGLGAVVVIGVFILILKLFAPSVLLAIAAPLWNSGTHMEASVGNAFAGLENPQVLAEQNASLKSQVLTLQNQNAILTTRAQDLTKLLGGQTNASTNILAGVLARPPLSPYDTLVVAAGTTSGVASGSPVFAEGGIPIGIVKSTTNNSATVQLLSTPNLTTNGWVGDNRVPLTLTGMGAGAFTATLPKAAAVSVGDSAYISGPGAVPIGTIVKIESDASSPTNILDIQPLVNIFSVTWVEIGSSS